MDGNGSGERCHLARLRRQTVKYRLRATVKRDYSPCRAVDRSTVCPSPLDGNYVIYISTRTRFEFDPEKDDANRGKYGVSLSFGPRVFEDADYLLIRTFREEDGEIVTS